MLIGVLLNYYFEIFPNEKQKSTMHSWINLCCQQYNSALLDKQRAYQKNKKNLTKPDLKDLVRKNGADIGEAGKSMNLEHVFSCL